MKTPLVAVLLSGSLVAMLPSRGEVPKSSALCTLMPFGRLKADSEPYFIGIVQAESAFAGPGSRPFRVGEGHFGPARDRPIYGQVVRVERWGGTDVGISRASGARAVVVPWDYGPDCATTSWSGHWLWLRPGARLFFMPRLRPAKQWADSLPTFDAYAPQFDAYPPRYADPAFGEAPKGLTVDQLFDLFQRLPTREAIAAKGWDAIDRVTMWAQAHPDLAKSYPANQIGWTVTYSAGESHARATPVQIAGTYLFTLTYPTGTRRSFYLRTADRASGPWHIIHRDTSFDEPPIKPWTKQLDGYELNTWVATDERDLPNDPDWQKRYQFPMGVRETAESSRGMVTWRADFETSGLFLFKVLSDPELDSLMSRHFRWFEIRWDSGGLVGDPGRFMLDDRGRMSFEQLVPLVDGRAIRISGERISRATVKDTAP